MKRYSAALLLAVSGVLAFAQPACATFHIIGIDQAFFGYPQAPDAQYVMLRLEFNAQTNVHGQPLPVEDGSGNPQAPFATFCSTTVSHCNLPTVSPACSSGGCPTALKGDGSRIWIATQRAQDLFCITADLVATGTLPFPNGRVCWAASCENFCTTNQGPVDCVAYGSFPAADNGIFGNPAVAPVLGEALVGSPDRQTQFNGGNLLDDAAGFSLGAPTPENFHGDIGAAGLSGDPGGTGVIAPENVDQQVSVMFQTDRRCDPELAPARRGADANLDTRVSAADLIATIQIVTAPQPQ